MGRIASIVAAVIVALGLGLLAGPLAAEAQQAGRVYRIGMLAAKVLPDVELPQDREGPRPDDPAVAAAARG